jgi:hypothetical protein
MWDVGSGTRTFSMHGLLHRQIAGMVYKDPDVSMAAIIESIKAFSNYTVNYGKAWRAKLDAISMLWGD